MELPRDEDSDLEEALAELTREFEQMNEDELHHRETALNAGGVELPVPVKITMTAISKLMTKTSYYL